MKKSVVLLSLLLLSSCAYPLQPAHEEESVPESSTAEESSDSSAPEDDEEDDPTFYIPEEDMMPEEIVEAYFEQQYLSYTSFMDIDLSAILDMRSTTNRNMVEWCKILNQRRRLIYENGFCYVETGELPYTVSFEQEPEDNRMQVWGKRLVELEMTVLHFRIKGEEGKAYPPIMALNSQHSIWFRQVDGVWKIAMHYFPGSRRKYGTGSVELRAEEEMLADLELEFETRTLSDDAPVPEGSRGYNAENAAIYALKYTEEKNPDFHDIGDWIGNCANFVSQSVWAGFGAEAMTSEWNDGSPAWNHVGYFWDYITSGYTLGGQKVGGAADLINGDIIQTRPASMTEEPDRFTHELIVVDESTLLLAQNTPAAFVYYSDLANVQTRAIRPVYLR